MVEQPLSVSQSEHRIEPARVSVVILNWNGRDVLRQCLQSLEEQSYPLEDVILVDNASSDGSAEMVETEFPGVIILPQDQNLGAPKGRNVGLREALRRQSEYIFTIDNDLFGARNTIAELVRVLDEHPDIGIVGAGIYHADRPDVIFSAGHWINWTQNLVGTRGANQPDRGQLAPLEDVDYVGIGAMLTRRDVYETIGLPDEDYIGYGYEDTEYGLRARTAGYRVVCYLPAKVWHQPHTGVGRYSFKKKYLEARNAIRFMRLYGTPYRWAKFSFYAGVGLIYALVREGPRGNIGGVIGKARGLYDGLRNRDEFALRLLEE